MLSNPQEMRLSPSSKRLAAYSHYTMMELDAVPMFCVKKSKVAFVRRVEDFQETRHSLPIISKLPRALLDSVIALAFHSHFMNQRALNWMKGPLFQPAIE